MTPRIPRLRMFAGPNGSGKSTLKSLLAPELLGIYINPDEIQKVIQFEGGIDLSSFGITNPHADAIEFFLNSGLAIAAGITELGTKVCLDGFRLQLPQSIDVAPYVASIAADYIRHELISSRVSFTFETVMSSADKIDLLRLAQRSGYRTYLYYVATSDPAINLQRIRERVKNGGHDVPEDKVISRYHRSLSLLRDAIRNSNRAYVFDNSDELTWLAEATEAASLEFKADILPRWFQEAVLDKLG